MHRHRDDFTKIYFIFPRSFVILVQMLFFKMTALMSRDLLSIQELRYRIRVPFKHGDWDVLFVDNILWMGHATLMVINGTTSIMPYLDIKSLQLIWNRAPTGARFLNELQRLDYMEGYPDSSSSPGSLLGDIPHCYLCIYDPNSIALLVR